MVYFLVTITDYLPLSELVSCSAKPVAELVPQWDEFIEQLVKCDNFD